MATVGLLLTSCNSTKPKAAASLHQPFGTWKDAGKAGSDIERQYVPPPQAAAGEGAREGDSVLAAGEPIWLQSGKSRVIRLARPVTRVSVGDPELAGVVVLGPRTILLNAKRLPEPTDAESAPQGVVVRRPGTVSNRPFTAEPRITETTVVFWYGEGGVPDAHSLFVADFIDQQVMLEVTVAEINRTAMEEHGIDFRRIGNDFVSAYFMGGGAGSLGTVPPVAPLPLFPLSTTPDSPTYAFQVPRQDITAFIKLLQTEGLATVLAQPKMLALSGQSAVFQVGGEIPIRIVTGFVADIQFKPFGTLVNFVPRISEEGDIILTVTPEVSQPDFTRTVEDIPTFRTRRASTSARLRNGETLVIGGLLQTTRREEVRGVPYLQDIPYAGYVFRDTQYIDELTELVVVVTPHLVRPLPPGTEMVLPTDRGPLTDSEIRTQPHPAEATRPRVPGLE